MASRALLRLRRERLARRVLIALVALCLIALVTAGLVWLLEAFHTYSPAYYEPKDMERERYEQQRQSLDVAPRSVRSARTQERPTTPWKEWGTIQRGAIQPGLDRLHGLLL